MQLLTTYRPDDACSARRARTTRSGCTKSRVWIVDPLDGTREYCEPPRDDWAIHVALWQDGDLVAGAVAQPGMRRRSAPPTRPVVPPRTSGRPRIACQPHPAAGLRRGAGRADRRRAGADGIGRRQGHLGRARRHATSTSTPVASTSGTRAAPVVVARAAGLHTSRADGATSAYNQDDVWLPDLLVCRPESPTTSPRSSATTGPSTGRADRRAGGLSAAAGKLAASRSGPVRT